MAKKQIHDISQSTTQLFLDLYDITNDLIILGDGATSLVISVSAMNFGLLSEGEQDATIYAYAALLNSLSFPIQIVIRSQPKDVTAYIKTIQDMEDTTTNPTYRQKIKEYREFVQALVQDQNVLDKKFYIVIPLSAVEMGLTTQSVVPGAKNKPLSSFEKNYIIEKAKTNLIPRKDHLIDQLARIGLYSRQLTTQELIQMLYSSYNPESFEGLKVTDTSHYTTPLVQAKIQGDFMMDTTTPVPNMAPPATEPSVPSMTTAPTGMTQPPIQSFTPAQTVMPAPTMPPVSAQPEPIPTATTPIIPVMSVAEEPKMPEFNQTPLGFSTPAQMAGTAPVEPIPQPAMTSAPVANPVDSPISESPAVATPPELPTEPTPLTPPAAEVQSMINQTLSQASPMSNAGNTQPQAAIPQPVFPGVSTQQPPFSSAMPTPPTQN